MAEYFPETGAAHIEFKSLVSGNWLRPPFFDTINGIEMVRLISNAIPDILRESYGTTIKDAQAHELRESVELLMARDGVEVARKKLRSLNYHLRKMGKDPVLFDQGHPLFWTAYLDNGHPDDSYIPPPVITGEELAAFLGRRGWAEWRLSDFAGIKPSTITRMIFSGHPISSAMSSLVRLMMENDRLSGSPNSDQRPGALLTSGEVAAYRESKFLYQRHMAKRTGYSVRTVRHMELGSNPVSPLYSAIIRIMMENDRLTDGEKNV